MGKFSVRYLVSKPQKGGHVLYYWEPKKRDRELGGFRSRALGSNLEKAIERASAFNAELDAWRKGLVKESAPERESVAWLINEYRKDHTFLRLAPRTRSDYEKQFDRIKLAFKEKRPGDLSARAVTRAHAKQVYHGLTHSLRQAQYFTQVARIVFGFGKDIGVLEENPFTNLKVRTPKPRDQIWTPEEIEAFTIKAIEMNRASIARAVCLGANTGQREQDILAMSWNQYDGKYIQLKQKKTGVELTVPCLSWLREALNKATRKSTLMVINDNTGAPYSGDYFRQLVRSIADASSIRKDLTFMDLRRTAVVRLAEAGCTTPEIASITGHSIEDCQRIIDTYLPKTKKLAENAILKLENKSKSWKKGKR